MSASVSEHQKHKGNLGKPLNSKLSNGPKDHHAGEREDLDSWRNQQQSHHQGYSSVMGQTSDPYMPSYYGSFQYPTGPGFSEGPWSNGDMAFIGGGGYSGGMHETGPPSGHYNNMEGGMFGGGNAAGGFGSFGGQPGFGYGFHGNGDYNAWGQPRKHNYNDYYRTRDGMYGDGMKMIDGMSGLSLSDKEHSLKEMKEMMSGGSKKTTWATIASQPAKPQSLMKKKAGLGGMPPPPIMLGTWEKNGSVPKAPIAAPVQAPNPPAWERMERVPKMPAPTPPSSQNNPPPLSGTFSGPTGPPPPQSRGYQDGNQMTYNSLPHQPSPAVTQQVSQLQNNSSNSNHSHTTSNSNNHIPPPAPPTSAPTVATGKQSPSLYRDEAKIKSDYNPATFDLSAEGARFFVIKSYSEDDIHRSIKYEIWCSTENGNKRLDDAWREREGKGPIYLFFSVNSSGHFCGMAQMMSGVDHEASSSVWCQDKWKGQFKVKWVYVKDVPNIALRHIRLENNENKSVTNSRDTQEVLRDKGKQVLKIIHTYQHSTSIFDDFIHYEKRQEEEDHKRTTMVPSNFGQQSTETYKPQPQYGRDRSNRDGGGSHNNYHHGDNRNDFGHRDNHRDHHQDDRPYQSNGRGMRGGGGGFDRENFGRGFDRSGGGGDRDFFRDRDRGDHHHRGGGRGGRPPRN